ncbi:MAG: hypothetical protein JWL76_1565 [Thermoleophilia bacterium]|nr:hypothetical protein [Thermoleophilia bacterium]
MPVLPSIGTKLGAGWGQFLKHAPLAGDDFADVLKDQVRFRITRAGATSVDDVVPDSKAARLLWKRPETRQVVQGVLDLANEVSGSPATPLRGFTLATSDVGYLANRAVHSFRPGHAPTMAAYEAALDVARAHISDTVAVRKGAWLHMGPERSRGLIHALEHPGTPRDELSASMRTSLGRGTKTLLHELNHVGSKAPAPWISEGKAETLARWPGRVPHAGRTMGIDVPTGVGRWADDIGPYQDEVTSVRAIMRMAGLDPRRSRNFAEAERLLNGTPPEDLVKSIADRVAKRHGTTAKERNALRRTVTDLIENRVAPDGVHANPRAVHKLARELERTRRVRLAAAD